MPALFAFTLFVSAMLLFVVQPMVGKLVLPLLGGTPAVWNTCLVFFQVSLLAGYAYAHWTTSILGVRRQAGLHLALLIAPLFVFPIALPAAAIPDDAVIDRPVPWLLTTLAIMVGLPFFVVATSGPLLQRWFASTGHPDAHDPYYLYAASNLGSFAALIGYPLLVEPQLTLSDQGRWWMWGYLTFVVLVAACASSVLWKGGWVVRWLGGSKSKDERIPDHSGSQLPNHPTTQPPNHLLWLLLSAIPSALLVSVTNYLTTDIAAVPLLWVLPLALYLLSFVLAFSRWRIMPRRMLAALLPILVLILLLAMLIHATEPIWLLLPGHLATMFVASWVCHGELAHRRPPIDRLTHFYLIISLGGAIGGLASALAAPLIFRAPQNEYALTLIAACAVAPSVRRTLPQWRLRDLWRPLKLGLGTAIVVWIVNMVWPDPGRWLTGGIFGLPLIGAALLMDRPRHFAAALAAVFGASLLFDGPNGPALITERNFFGVVRVTREPGTGWHRLVHGNTVHGRQAWFDGEPDPTPLTYYHPTGPAGQMFRAIGGRFKRVANCGLGTGALAYYAKRNQEWIFYEIDPSVVRVAQDPNLFTFLRESAAAPCPIMLGDARLQLRHAPDAGFDLIVVDCFSSDSIPVHLLTREALALYLQKLAPGGLLMFHISNRYLDLKPVLASLAADAKLEVCRVREDTRLDDDERAAGKMPSVWAILARKSDDLGPLKISGMWIPADLPPGFRVWTDDFSHLWGVFQWQ